MIYNVIQCAPSPLELKTLDFPHMQLSVVYLLGTSTAHVVWPMLGLGVRFIQEKGIHRRKGQQERTVKDESEKLAFWSVISLIHSIRHL
jgi:hypothetical protein